MIGEVCRNCGYKDDSVISVTSLADELKNKHFIELTDLLTEPEVYELLEFARTGTLTSHLKILKQLRSMT